MCSACPGRSGPKRLDSGRCDIALTTSNRRRVSTAVPHPRQGRCLSTLVNGLRELCLQTALDAHVRSRLPSSSTTHSHRRCSERASASSPPPARPGKSSELRYASSFAIRAANWLRVSPGVRRGKRWSRPRRMCPMTVSCRYTSPKRPASQLQSESPLPSQLVKPELRSASSNGAVRCWFLRATNQE